MKRTHTCGELTNKDIGKEVILNGWLHSRRDHGGLVFIDLRDRYGLTQVVFDPSENKQLAELSHELKSEYVLAIKGIVRPRPEGTQNTKIKTGGIEIKAEKLEILNVAQTPVFEIDDHANISEDSKYKYRFLDLRRPSSQQKLFKRHRMFKAMRDYLSERDFIEVETPILTKSTPEGARDYLVPSRLNIGKFYALPQSPQLFKQILMVAGFERYFQIAKCFRDEDLRADRQPEFTQLDIEMSFVDEEDIYSLTEGLFKKIFKELLDAELKTPFPRLKYSECMERFGIDKPDLRIPIEIANITDLVDKSEFKVFKDVKGSGGVIRGINVKGAAGISRAQIDELTEFARQQGAKGLAYFKVTKDSLESPIAKFFPAETLAEIKKRFGSGEGDMILLIADTFAVSCLALSSLTRLVAAKFGLVKTGGFEFLWVTDFPLFKYNAEEKRWESEHHPFTSPDVQDLELLEKDPSKARSRSYDIVLNGTELGSGSIRIHKREMQEKVFKILGIGPEEAKEKFGFLLDAFSFGAPPHGGIAYGVDRLLAMMTNSESIRDVIAFPKTQKAVCPMTNAPSDVSPRQLKELGLKL